jgi:hypothetical protein
VLARPHLRVACAQCSDLGRELDGGDPALPGCVDDTGINRPCGEGESPSVCVAATVADTEALAGDRGVAAPPLAPATGAEGGGGYSGSIHAKIRGGRRRRPGRRLAPLAGRGPHNGNRPLQVAPEFW